MFIFQSLSDFSREKVPDELYVADDEEVAVWLDWQKLFLRPAGRGMRVIDDGKEQEQECLWVSFVVPFGLKFSLVYWLALVIVCICLFWMLHSI